MTMVSLSNDPNTLISLDDCLMSRSIVVVSPSLMLKTVVSASTLPLARRVPVVSMYVPQSKL